MPILHSWCDVSARSSGYRLSLSQKFLGVRTADAQSETLDFQFSDFQAPDWIKLSFSKLSCFESVTDQFTAWGVEIKDAIAIKPSNFAFSSCIDQIVLIPLTRHNRIAVQFNRPRKNVTVSLVAPRSVQLVAYGRDRHLLTQSTTAQPAAMQRAEEIQPLPSQTLQAVSDTITQITLHSTAPFALQSVTYC